MRRIRSTRLLSGVSAIALIASAGAISPASAGQTFTGPNLFPAYTNTSVADFILLDGTAGQAVLNVDGSGNSLINNFAMSGAGGKININTSVLLGNLVNNSSIVSSNATGIDINTNSVVVGTIVNNGLIQGSTGINLNASTLIGGIVNNASSSIIGGSDGIHITNGATFIGGIINHGLISGGSNGIDFDSNTVNFVGGITNDGTIRSTSASTSDAAIEIGVNSFVGGITNLSGGLISGTNNADGIRLGEGAFAGGINNTGLINGNNGINIEEGMFAGGITNNSGGTIQGKGTAAIWFQGNGGATFTGGINNTGLIRGTATANGIQMDGGTFSNGITNNAGGTITAAAVGGKAILISAGTFNGNIVNNGLILETGLSAAAIVISGASSFNGSITNNSGGTIHGGDFGIVVSNTSFTGGIINNGLIISDGSTSDAISIAGTTFSGGITNGGIINGAHDAIAFSGATFNGGITNDGTLLAGQNGIRLGGTTFNTDVVNNGLISAGNEGISVTGGTTVTGSITNSSTGTIVGGFAGIVIHGTVSGGIVNNGLIDPTSGIKVDGTVGSVTNNSGGTITATANAINLEPEDGATAIFQTGGLIQGRSGSTITTALRLDQIGTEYNDSYTASGGILDGNVVGGAGSLDGFYVTTNSTFAYRRGRASDLFHLDVTGNGTAVFGSTARGVDGEGVTFDTTDHMWFAGKGRVYLDDNTTINLTDYYTQHVDNTLEFYLTSDLATHGQINAANALNLNGKIAVFINGTTFGAIGGNTFPYQDVLTGPVTGTFTNASNIITNSLFFTGEAIVNAADVDIVLTRQSFSSALILPGITQNEGAIGGALNTIYNNGPANYGPDMTKLFNYLLNLNGGEAGDALFVFNELSGVEHAQLQQTTLDILNPFNTFMGHRLDGAKASLGGAGWARNGGQQYAQASSVMSDASLGVTRGSSDVSIWGAGYGQTLKDRGDIEAPGYRQNTGGAAAGVDFALGDNALAGAALGWSSTDVKFNTPGDKANVDSFQLGAYATYGFGRFYLDGEASGAFDSLNTTRLLNLPMAAGGAKVAGANYDARSISASAEFGAIWHAGDFALQPNAGVLFTNTNSNSFIESGAGDFNLIVGDTSAQSLASLLGMRASTQFKAGGMTFVPEASGAWRHELDDNHQAFTAAFPNAPTSTFSIISSKISPDSALVEAGITAGVSKGLELFIDYNGLLNSDVTVHNGTAGLRATW